jgi:flagellar hook-associated protein 2
MASITSLGIGSGLDLNSLVTQLVSLERRPLQQMQADQRRLEGQVSSYGRIQSQFSALRDAANRLTSPELWTRTLARSSNEAAVSVGATSTAAAGSYSVRVDRLAQGQTLASAASYPASTALVGAGTLRIDLGTWGTDPVTGDPTFAAGPRSTGIDIGADDTLASVRDRINAANAGVTASLVTDSSGVRLALRSAATGAETGFRITATDPLGGAADPAGLGRLAYDPSVPGGPAGLELKQPAQDALAVVNGIAVSSASNEVQGVIEGLTLRLGQVGAAPVEVSVSTDRAAVDTAVRGLAEAYNTLVRNLAEQTRYDPGSRVAGPLQGDGSAVGLIRQLREVVSAGSGASTVFRRLTDLGLELQRDGTLSVQQGRLDTALQNLPELRQALANSDTAQPANQGFARRWSQLAQQVLAIDGTVSTRSEALRQRITRLGEAQERVEERAERFRERLVAQYTVMDANVARLNAINSALTQQLAALNPPRD